MTSLTQQPFADLAQRLEQEGKVPEDAEQKKFAAGTFDPSLVTRAANGQFTTPDNGATPANTPSAGASPNSIGPGSSQQTVAQVQSYLQDLGYGAAGTPGTFGPATAAALSKYQKDHGLKVTGTAGLQTLTSLRDHLAAGASPTHSHKNGHAAGLGHGGAARFQPGGGNPTRIRSGNVVGGTGKPYAVQGKEGSSGLEHKTLAGGEAKTLDEEQGIVEALVSITGIKDRVNDIIKPGAYAKTLAERVPKICHSHDWDTPVGKTLEAVELMPGDPRLPATTPQGKPWPREAGALYIKMQYNLETQRGREDFSDVKFYGKDCQWSIGYNVPAGSATIERKNGTRNIHELELFEASSVLHGAAPESSTLSVKALDPQAPPTYDQDLDDDSAPRMAAHLDDTSAVTEDELQRMHDDANAEIASEIQLHLQQAAAETEAAGVHEGQQVEAGLASKGVEPDVEEKVDTAPGDEHHGGNAQALRDYWAHGEGAAKIAWGTPGDFDRCVAEVGKYMPGQAEGYCNLRHHDALGIYPATHAKLDREGHPDVAAKSEFDENFLEGKDVWTGSGPAQATGGFGATQFGNVRDALSAQAEHPKAGTECPHCHADDLVKRRDGDLVCPSCGFHYADARTPLDEVGNARAPYDGALKSFNPAEARDPHTGKWRTEFAVGGKWYTNALRFDTPEAAKAEAADRFSRWTQPAAWRVVPHEHPMNETYDGTGHRSVVEASRADHAEHLNDAGRLHAHLVAEHPGGGRVDPFPAEDLEAYQHMHQRAHQMGVDSHSHDMRIEPKTEPAPGSVEKDMAPESKAMSYLPCPKCRSRKADGNKCADCGAALADKFGKAFNPTQPRDPATGKWRAEFAVEGKWYTNALRWNNAEDAKREAANMFEVADPVQPDAWRVVPHDHPMNEPYDGTGHGTVVKHGSAAEQVLSSLAGVREGERRAAMIYQRDAKERAAREAGLAFDAYHHLPYAEWAAIRDENPGIKSRMSASVGKDMSGKPVEAEVTADENTLVDNGDPTRSKASTSEDDQDLLEPENWLPCPTCKLNDPVIRTGRVVCAADGTALQRKAGGWDGEDDPSPDHEAGEKALKAWSALAQAVATKTEIETKEIDMTETPTFAESALTGSMEDLQARLTEATDAWAAKSDGAWTQIEGTWPDHVLFTAYDEKAEQPHTSWQAGFEITEDGTVELGEPQQVETVTLVVPSALKAITGMSRLMQSKGLDPDLLSQALDRIADSQQGLDEVELLQFQALKEFALPEGVEVKRDYSHAERMEMAADGRALPDGSFPIKDKEDLKNAVALRRAGDGKDPEAADAHIAKRAASLGVAVKSLTASGMTGGTGGGFQRADVAPKGYIPGGGLPKAGGHEPQRRAAQMLQNMHDDAKGHAASPYASSAHETASTYLKLADQHLAAGNVSTAKEHLGRALSAHDRSLKDGDKASFGRIGGRAVATLRGFVKGAISQDDAGGDVDDVPAQVTSGARGHAGNIRGLEAAHDGKALKPEANLGKVKDDDGEDDDDDADVENDLSRVKSAKGKKASKAQAALFQQPAELDDLAKERAEFAAMQAGL